MIHVQYVLSNAIIVTFRLNMVFRRKCVLSNAIIAIFRINIVFRRRCVLSNAIIAIFRINMVFRTGCVLSNAIIAIFRINIVFRRRCVLSNAIIAIFRINMVFRTGCVLSNAIIVTFRINKHGVQDRTANVQVSNRHRYLPKNWKNTNIRKNPRISILRKFSPKTPEFSKKFHEFYTKSLNVVRVQSRN